MQCVIFRKRSVPRRATSSGNLRSQHNSFLFRGSISGSVGEKNGDADYAITENGINAKPDNDITGRSYTGKCYNRKIIEWKMIEPFLQNRKMA
jgi:hypothetical protein